MNPDRDVRVARREALPHLRKEVRILPTNGSAPWRAIPSYPEGRQGDGAPGAAKKQGGGALPIDVPGLFEN